jgi:hypothetical protein
MEKSIKDHLDNKMDEIEKKFDARLAKHENQLSEVAQEFRKQFAEIQEILGQINTTQNHCNNCNLCRNKDGDKLDECELIKGYINGN